MQELCTHMCVYCIYMLVLLLVVYVLVTSVRSLVERMRVNKQCYAVGKGRLAYCFPSLEKEKRDFKCAFMFSSKVLERLGGQKRTHERRAQNTF